MRAWVEGTTAAQGLLVKVTDPAVVSYMAAIFTGESPEQSRYCSEVRTLARPTEHPFDRSDVGCVPVEVGLSSACGRTRSPRSLRTL
jgi:hypothetical protein